MHENLLDLALSVVPKSPKAGYNLGKTFFSIIVTFLTEVTTSKFTTNLPLHVEVFVMQTPNAPITHGIKALAS
jgi:hypothetical protein